MSGRSVRADKLGGGGGGDRKSSLNLGMLQVCRFNPLWCSFSQLVRTKFYLVCGGEVVMEREKHDREQMNMIHKTIISQGLARDDHIVFVHGRGQGLSPTCTMYNSFPAKGFKMYSPNAQSAPSSDDNGNYFMALLE